MLALGLLLLLPGAAVVRLSTESVDYRILLGCWAGISLLTYALYARDKRQAQRSEWRTPEFHLHIAELLGGWAAAFVAQRVIRHKISKPSFMWKFWAIVAAYQYAALDYLLGWTLIGRALQVIH